MYINQTKQYTNSLKKNPEPCKSLWLHQTINQRAGLNEQETLTLYDRNSRLCMLSHSGGRMCTKIGVCVQDTLEEERKTWKWYNKIIQVTDHFSVIQNDVPRVKKLWPVLRNYGQPLYTKKKDPGQQKHQDPVLLPSFGTYNYRESIKSLNKNILFLVQVVKVNRLLSVTAKQEETLGKITLGIYP